MNEEKALKVFKRIKAVQYDDHFVLASYDHSSTYINKDLLYIHHRETKAMCTSIAENLACLSVEVVIGPAMGGVIPSSRVAEHLSDKYGHGRDIPSIFADKVKGGFEIRPDFIKIIKGEDNINGRRGRNVLVVDDVITTGQSVKKVIEAVCKAGGNVVGVGALWNRGGIRPKEFGNIRKLYSLVNWKLETWPKALCPLCAADIPVNTELGRGKEYLSLIGSSGT